jgi:hypothetical protein
MRYFLTYKGASTAPPTPEQMAAIGKFGEEMAKAGVLVSQGGLLPPPKEGRFRLENGKFTDGPFTETKELAIGYAIVEAKSDAEAIELARRFMRIAGDGEAEVRRMMGEGDHPH